MCGVGLNGAALNTSNIFFSSTCFVAVVVVAVVVACIQSTSSSQASGGALCALKGGNIYVPATKKLISMKKEVFQSCQQNPK